MSITVTPSSLTFSDAMVQQTTPAQTVTITNTGTTSVILTAQALPTPFVFHATLSTPSPVTLAPNASFTVSFTAQSTTAGLTRQAFVFSTNNSAQPNVSIPLAVVSVPFVESDTLCGRDYIFLMGFGDNPGTFAPQPSGCAGTPEVATRAARRRNSRASEDMLDWIMMPDPLRTTNHLTGPSLYAGFWMDADGKKLWYIKNSAGNPWDITTYDANYIYFWLTENGDQNAWNNASGFKRYLNPVPAIPRNFDPAGSAVTLSTPGLNSLERTLDCGADAQPLINIGPIVFVTTPAVSMAWGGDIGTQPTIVVSYHYGANGSVTTGSREQYFYVKGFGQVEWTMATASSPGNFVVSQTSLTNTLASGGCPTPNFPCYSALQAAGDWIGDAPGAGGNATTPGTGGGGGNGGGVTPPPPPPPTTGTTDTRQVIMPTSLDSELSQSMTFNDTLWDNPSNEKVMRRLQFYYENVGVCTLTATARVQRYNHHGKPFTDSQKSVVTFGTEEADGLEYSDFFDFQLAGEIIDVTITREASAGPCVVYQFIPFLEDKGEKVENK